MILRLNFFWADNIKHLLQNIRAVGILFAILFLQVVSNLATHHINLSVYRRNGLLVFRKLVEQVGNLPQRQIHSYK